MSGPSDMIAAELPDIKAYIERALGSLSVLHIGPLDYNIACTIDDLRVAERLLSSLYAESIRGGAR